MPDIIQIIDESTNLTITDNKNQTTTLVVENESIDVLEVTKQGVAGTSYYMTVDDVTLSGNVRLVSDGNVSITPNEEDNSILFNVNLDDADITSDKTYVHTQSVASSEWTINHYLNKYPSVTIVDSANSTVIGDVTYVSLNQLIVTFSAEFGGKAYVN